MAFYHNKLVTPPSINPPSVLEDIIVGLRNLQTEGIGSEEAFDVIDIDTEVTILPSEIFTIESIDSPVLDTSINIIINTIDTEESLSEHIIGQAIQPIIPNSITSLDYISQPILGQDQFVGISDGISIYDLEKVSVGTVIWPNESSIITDSILSSENFEYYYLINPNEIISAENVSTDNNVVPVVLANYRYWRIYITDTENNMQSAGLNEITLLASGNPLPKTGTATADSWYQPIPYPPGNAIDDSLQSKWWTNNVSSNHWLQYDHGSVLGANEIEITVPDEIYYYERPTDFIIQGSSDGLSWDNLREEVNYVWSITNTYNGTHTESFML